MAPPRTIADITAILDQEKPDPVKRAKAEAEANAEPGSAKGAALSEFYFKRCQARGAMGRPHDAVGDCEKAIAIGGDYANYVSRVEQILEQQLAATADFKRSIELLKQMGTKLNAPGSKGRMFGIYTRLTVNSIWLGDLKAAEDYARRGRDLLAESRNWKNSANFRSSWESSVASAKGRIAEARGRYRDAEAGYTQSARLLLDAKAKSSTWPSAPSSSFFDSNYDYLIVHAARAKAYQGRLAEAEMDTRRSLLSRLKTVGKYNQDTAQMILALGNLITEQARYAEAEQLARTALEIYQTLGYPDDAQPVLVTQTQLAGNIFSQGRYEEAKQVFATIDEAIKGWDPKRAARFQTSWSRIFAHYYTREVDKGIALAREYLERQRSRVGDKHFDSAMARAMVACGLTFARRDADAMREFKAAMPLILASVRENDDDDATSKQAVASRLQNVIETYIALLGRIGDHEAAAVESFQLADSIRGRSVQNALAASGARSAMRNPVLAELARKEQDLEKQFAAELGTLNNTLSLPPEERDDNEVRALQAGLEKLRAERQSARREIERRFPEYASLTAPKSLTVADVREALRPDEAFVSFYFGRRSSFVWAVSKNGPVAFATINMRGNEIDEKILKLRETLSLNVSTVEEVPPFDLALAYELYKDLLAPVETGWRSAKSIAVVSNGALGTLPLSLLPTESPGTIDAAEPLFTGYRKVAWLARTHAVTTLPSASSLRTLRGLPQPAGAREDLIGFGDPLFNEKQASEQVPAQVAASRGVAARGVPFVLRAVPKTRGVDSAEIAALPRLPDTADELRSIALALHADPAKVLHLGKSANEKAVKTLDLSRYRIVAFATHGLVPGELDGLTQPALALSAPNVADVDGDGLLTMEEILALKLNADWVVLSACNTGAAAAAGAEAASGLGRAFFYAGTRALLVTNWAVHSASARELVSDIFRRQSADPKLTRAEALRQAMLAVLDNGGWKDSSGKILFSYAHPLFWAPYTIIGDGGR